MHCLASLQASNMTHHIFFSWQSDTPTLTGRNLIERALQRAIAVVAADTDIDPANRDLTVDRDSVGVPGSPPLVETIFGKVDCAAAFLSDLTYVATRKDGRRMPNPNVLLEHGWALKALSWRRVFSVMNIAQGHPDDHPLPFDLQHFKRPIFYDCPDNADENARRAARDGLTRQFVTALRAILDDEALRVERVSAAPAEPHPHDFELLASVQRQLPVGLQRFLQQHSFGTPFRRDNLNPMHEMNEDWVGARFEFHDAVLQAAFAELQRLAREFGNLIGTHTHVMDENTVLAWPKTDCDVAHGVQPSTLAAITAMNAKAGELSAAIDVFERTARDRIRVAVAAGPAASGADAREERARTLLAELAQDRNAGQLPGIVTRPSVTLRIIPLAAMERRRLDPQQVARAQLRFPPNERERVQTDSDGRQWWSNGLLYDVGKPNGESRWRTRLVRPGAIEYEATIGFRIDDDPEIMIDGRVLETDIVIGVERLGAALAELGLDGQALVEISFDGVEDVKLSRPRGGGRKIGRPQIGLPVALVDDLMNRPADALHEQFDILWQAAGWAEGSPSFGDGGWNCYRAATAAR
jgi:hypothetical protein